MIEIIMQDINNVGFGRRGRAGDLGVLSLKPELVQEKSYE
jgi:hypothetical protein